MLEIVSWYILHFIAHILDCYVFSKIIKEKMIFKLKLILFCIILALFDSLSSVYNDVLKMIISNLGAFFILKIIYKKSTLKTILGVFFISMGYVLSEAIYAIVLSIVIKNYNFVFETSSGIFISNIIIFILYLGIYSIKRVLILINNIVNWCDESKVFKIIFNCLIAVVICFVMLFQISFNTLNNSELVTIFAILVAILVFVIGYFNQKSTNNKLSIEYSEMLEYSKTYEQEVEEKSKNQHEYKNQLILLDSMIPSTNKKAKNYIKKLIDEENNINENDWMNKLKNLPNNGIKGFINFKIKKMIDNNIVVCVNIDSKLSTKKYWKNFEDNMEKVSKVLGVYLDNAIEAASNSSDKQIIIEFINSENNIEFVLSNSFSGMINYSEMDKQGYSTKGRGRGYGLSLAKDIIKNSDILNSTREINGKFYVQKLYIKK